MTETARLPERGTLASPRAASPVAARFWAFLSYSHRDTEWADWLHNALEGYRVPSSVVGRVTSAGTVPERLAPVFRDRHELAASADLSADIRGALAASRTLIVLCSPAAATSHWVNEEIATFKRLRPDGCVLAAIVDGEPFASERPGREADECFPPALRQRFDKRGRPTAKRAEPIAADFRETGDGKRLGKLKLVAGMLDVRLDELARREAQRRHRRLVYLAAGSLAGMVVTSGLAIIAVQARNEAQAQRSEAEGLVGFMLGDLRGRLEPLGRLDVLDSVGSRALGYYQKQDKGSLSEEGLAQRSRALTMIGEIAQRRGDLDGALRRYAEAQTSTAESLRRAPSSEQRIFDHAQNVFWVGYIAWQRGRTREAESSFREYKRLAVRLTSINPHRPEWQLEGVYADTNLGTLLLEQRQFDRAVGIFQDVLNGSQALAAATPGKRAYQVQVVETLAYLSDAQEGSGRLEDAMRSREKQLMLLKKLLASDSSNIDFMRSSLTAERAIGRLFGSRGEVSAALGHLRTSISLAEELLRSEPDNSKWLEWLARAHLDLGDLLLAVGSVDEAGSASRAACDIANNLVKREPSVIAWRTDVLRSCLVLRARLAAKKGGSTEALALASQVLAAMQPARGAQHDLPYRYASASAYMLAGDQLFTMGRAEAARAHWQRALGALPHVAESPSQQAQRYVLLRKLGRVIDAKMIGDRLDAIGYRHPNYVQARQSSREPRPRRTAP